MSEVKPAILLPDYGVLNRDLRRQQERLQRGKAYRDLSTICVTPTPGNMLPVRMVAALRNLIIPMNQRFIWLPITGMEVGAAYEAAIEMILANPELSKWQYLLTFEHDNIPPPDGLLKLYESIDDYDVVGGLYWTKGEGGQPMIYGDPSEMPKSFRPQVPLSDTVQQANGLGMGFNLFRLSLFKDGKIGRPWFKSQQEYIEGKGWQGFSQDLFFYNQAGALGYRFACDTRVKVGHLAIQEDFVW